MTDAVDVEVFTAHPDYPGPHRLDAMRGPFAPSDDLESDVEMDTDEYHKLYWEEMRVSIKENRPYWNTVLGSKKVVLVCSCGLDTDECHLTTLVKILKRCGAKIGGEITEWDSTSEEEQEEERPMWTDKDKDAGVGTLVIITGDRRWTNEDMIRDRLMLYPKGSLVMNGDCEGADRISTRVAVQLDMVPIPMPPKESATGNERFTTRNTAMVSVGAAMRWCNWHVHIEAFVMPTSRGTWDCVNKAKKKGFKPNITKIEKIE